jgi:hypothetical protein
VLLAGFQRMGPTLYEVDEEGEADGSLKHSVQIVPLLGLW